MFPLTFGLFFTYNSLKLLALNIYTSMSLHKERRFNTEDGNLTKERSCSRTSLIFWRTPTHSSLCWRREAEHLYFVFSFFLDYLWKRREKCKLIRKKINDRFPNAIPCAELIWGQSGEKNFFVAIPQVNEKAKQSIISWMCHMLCKSTTETGPIS